MTPFWFVSSCNLESKTIIFSDTIGAGFSMVKVIGWTIVVRIATIMAPLWFVLAMLMMLVMVSVLQSHSLGRSHEESGCN
jgi:hypothetical protein